MKTTPEVLEQRLRVIRSQMHQWIRRKSLVLGFSEGPARRSELRKARHRLNALMAEERSILQQLGRYEVHVRYLPPGEQGHLNFSWRRGKKGKPNDGNQGRTR